MKRYSICVSEKASISDGCFYFVLNTEGNIAYGVEFTIGMWYLGDYFNPSIIGDIEYKLVVL